MIYSKSGKKANHMMKEPEMKKMMGKKKMPMKKGK